MSISDSSLFDRIRWRDPLGGGMLEPIVAARTPAGVPITGALRIAGTNHGYPIIDCVARLTPELAHRHADWLRNWDLTPPPSADTTGGLQAEETVESFGFQWNWNSDMRSEKDLQWRVADRFRLAPSDFSGRFVMDAGAGAGDQSRWMVDQGASVLSVDLSSAIDVVSRKLRLNPRWFGVQGDITALPLDDAQFDMVYCEGVIQHTRDSPATVAELCRVLAPGGQILATHYQRSIRRIGRFKHAYLDVMRERMSRMPRWQLLWLTGNLAALAYVPLLGRVVRKSGIALHYDLMPEFRTTWTNTFDWFGNHAYQRLIDAEEFWSYFDGIAGVRREFSDGALVVARKDADAGAAPPGNRGLEPHTIQANVGA
jgi:ubiquinone/menaquinone biosynthesis C-methylase UbiE